MKDAEALNFFHLSYQDFSPKLFLSTPSDKPKLTKKELNWKCRLAPCIPSCGKYLFSEHFHSEQHMELGTFPCIISCNLHNSYLLF